MNYPELIRLFGEACIYLALPLMILAIVADLIRDFFADDSTPTITKRADFAVVPRDFGLSDSKPTVPTYLSTRTVRERRQGSRKHR